MFDPTREQDSFAENLALTHASVSVGQPTTQGAPAFSALIQCWNADGEQTASFIVGENGRPLTIRHNR